MLSSSILKAYSGKKSTQLYSSLLLPWEMQHFLH